MIGLFVLKPSSHYSCSHLSSVQALDASITSSFTSQTFQLLEPKLKFVITKLNDALERFPEVQRFNLINGGDADSSAMIDVIEEDPESHWKITTVIALENDKPVGWAWVTHETTEYYSGYPDYKVLGTKRYLLSWLFVDPMHRRKGIGSKLYEQVYSISRKRHRPLRVDPWDKRSRAFFKTLNAKQF